MAAATTSFSSGFNNNNNADQSTDSSATISKSGNVASFKTTSTTSTYQTNLTAIDTYGNEFKVPDYTIKDILSAIPTHCYERRLLQSLSYVFRDIFCMVVLGFIANNYIHLIPNQFIRFAAWTGYVWCQGLFGTGIWVLAHECGHQAFSDYGSVNDFVGWVLHSYLLVPYFSWKFSHGKHHKATGHLTRDMVFVPKTKEEFLQNRGVKDLDDLLGDSPMYSLLTLIFQQTFGWISYLVANVSGQKYPGVSFLKLNHFNPNSLIFDKKDYWYILLSDLGILLQFFNLYVWYQSFGGFNLLVNYVLPYFLVNHWLVFITYNILILKCLIMKLVNGLLLVVLLLLLIVNLDLLANIFSMILLKLMFYIIMFLVFHFIMLVKLVKPLKKLWGFIINIVMKICGSRYGNLLDGVNLSMVIMGF